MTETENKLPDDTTLKNVVVLITCVTKNGDKFYPQLFLEVLVASKFSGSWWEMVKCWWKLVVAENLVKVGENWCRVVKVGGRY